MEKSGKKLMWWLAGAALLLLAAIFYALYDMNSPEKELGTLVDSFEYLERAVHLL